MAHRAWEACARRNGEVAMTYRAQLLAPERNSGAQQAGLPTDIAEEYRRCSLWLRRLRDPPRALESPLLYSEETRRACRDQAGKLPLYPPHVACGPMTLSRRLPLNSCQAIPLRPLPRDRVRSQTFSAILLAAPTRRTFSCRSCALSCRCSAPIRKSMPAPPRRAPSPSAAALRPDIPVADARIYPRMAWRQRATGSPRQLASRELPQRD